MKKAIMSYFSFTKKEFNGVVILCVVIILIAIAPSFYPFDNEKVYHFSEFEKQVNEFKASAELQKSFNYNDLKNEIEDKEFAPQYFKFNPNGLSVQNWRRLGLTSRQVKIIKNYENKGGKFYKKEDLKKIYSITPQDFARLEPYITIDESTFYKSYPKYEKREYHPKEKEIILVDINTADSTELEKLNNIGASFVRRIIEYRQKLGGFYSKEQLKEIYGLDSARFEGLKDQVMVSEGTLTKININTAAFNDLKRHPYLTYKQMNAIINYRKQHGNFTSIVDLKKVLILNDEILRKIEPYLVF